MNIFLTDLTLCDFVKDTKRAIYYKKCQKRAIGSNGKDAICS